MAIPATFCVVVPEPQEVTLRFAAKTRKGRRGDSGIPIASLVKQVTKKSGSLIDTCHREGSMNCPRCHGLMVGDDLMDIRESYLPMWMRGLRCISCGNIVDPVIDRNRMGQGSSVRRHSESEVRGPVMQRHAKAA